MILLNGMKALDTIKRIIKEKSSLILLCMLSVYTIFACTAHLSTFSIVMLYLIVISAPFIFDDTKAVCLYCFTACFMSCYGFNGNGFYLAFGVSTAILMFKKVILAVKAKDEVKTVVKISVVWLSFVVVYTAYTLIVNGITWRRTGIGLDLLQVCVLAFLIRKTVNIRDALTYLLAGIVSSVLIAYIFCVEGARHDFITGDYNYRFGAFFNNENTLAVFSTCCASCFIALILTERADAKTNWFYPLIATAFGLWAMSKAFLLISVALYLTWIIIGFFKAKSKSRHAIMTGALIAVVAIFCVIYREKVGLMLARFYGGKISDFWATLTTGRVEIWKEYIESWLSSPRTILFGNGFTAPKIPSGKYEHSVYIAFLNQYGVIGTIALFVVAIWTVKQSARMEKRFSAYIPFILLLVNGVSSNLSGVLCTCLPWLLVVCIFSYDGKEEKVESVEEEKTDIIDKESQIGEN